MTKPIDGPAPRWQREYELLAREGYAVLRGALDLNEDVQPLVDECGEFLDELIRSLHAAGELPHTYAGLGTLERLCAFVADTGRRYYSHLGIFLPFTAKTPDRPMYLHPKMFALMRSPRLLDAIEPILGPEIAVNPFHIGRIKPPEALLPLDVQRSPGGDLSQTVWHQDLWGFELEAVRTPLITVWVAITAADEESGCLLVAPGTHRTGEMEVHCGPSPARPGFKGIPPELVPEHRVPVVVEPGDVVLLDRLVQHSSLANRSQRLRWSYDLRYQAAGHPVGQSGRPAWIARSRSDPSLELTSFEEWRRLWRNVIERESLHSVSDPTRVHDGHEMCS